MLAFDIETMGLDSRKHAITAASAYDPEAAIDRTFVFPRGDSPEEFMALLDAADRLCAFNAVRFDLPFMAARWKIPDERVGAWVRKLFDPFEACKLGLNATFSLNALLLRNGIPVKISHGTLAIDMALNKEWDRLAEYCRDDTVKTYYACKIDGLLLPKTVAKEFECVRLLGGPWRVVGDV